MVEIELNFGGSLPDVILDECRIPAKSRLSRFKDCLNDGECVKVLTLDMKAYRGSKNKELHKL